MTENERDLYPTPDSPDEQPTPTSVRVPNVGSHARSGLDGTVLGDASEGADNAVGIDPEDPVIDHPAQDADEDLESYANTAPGERNLSSLEDGSETDTIDHPSQDGSQPADDASVGDPGYDVPTGSSDEVYAWVVGGDDTQEVINARAAAALAAEKAKPEEEQDGDLIALLQPPEPIEGQVAETTGADTGMLPPLEQAEGTPLEPATATQGEPVHSDVTTPADQQGATPTP